MVESTADSLISGSLLSSGAAVFSGVEAVVVLGCTILSSFLPGLEVSAMSAMIPATTTPPPMTAGIGITPNTFLGSDFG